MKLTFLILVSFLKLMSCGILREDGIKPSFSRIIKGVNDTETSNPYECSMQIGNWHFCGCAIISGKWVITSAHCANLYKMEEDPAIIRIGTRELDGGKVLGIKDRKIYDGYSPTAFGNDVGLIELNDTVTTDDATIIMISKKDVEQDEKVIFTGWGWITYDKSNPGRASYLQTIDLMTISNEECDKSLGDINESHLCTEYNSGDDKKGGICYGDSGGPLVKDDNNVKILVGVANFAAPCGQGHPDAFARISKFCDWIETTTKVECVDM